jgi:hypothetical protein
VEALARENRDLTGAHGVEALRRAAERPSRAEGAGALDGPGGGWDIEALAPSGRPFYRLLGAPAEDPQAGRPAGGYPGPVSSAGADAAPPVLVPAARLERRRALAATGLLVCVLLGVWVLSGFPACVARLRSFWPEQAVLLGLFGLRAFGPTWPVVFLLALGGVARLLALASALRSLLQRCRSLPPRPA